MIADNLRVLIVEARFYDEIADEMLAGAGDALQAYGAEYDVISVPGAFELPAAVAPRARGRPPAGRSALRRLRRLGLRDPRRDHPLRLCLRRVCARPYGSVHQEETWPSATGC